MDGFEEYFGMDNSDTVREKKTQHESKSDRDDMYRDYNRQHNPRERRTAETGRNKNGFFSSRAFLSAVVVVIYITSTVMLFAFSKDLGVTVKEEEEATVADNVLDNPVYPEDYVTVLKSASEIYDGFLLLVNSEYACRHDGIDLVNVSENYNHTYQITDYAVEANRTTLEHMDDMFADFKAAVGENDLMISCDYRSMELQEQLYEEEIEEKGEEEGSKWVAKPGYSEHQTGYAFDLTLRDEDGIITEFDGQGKYAWIAENCEKYGFIVRYPEEKTDITGIYHEPWHLRYVGIAHACYIKENNLCLEEYIDAVKSYDVQNPLEYQDCGMNRWCIYYVPAAGGTTSISVPSDKEYEISGNNVDGFIVSVKMN